MVSEVATKGIRLNNPGNIEHGQPWDGLSSNQPDPRFCAFILAEFGIRAIHKVLQAYEFGHQLDSVHKMIERWAPPGENNTAAYIADVANRSHVDSDEHLNIMDPYIAYNVVTGIIAHENSNYEYPEEIVWKGLQLAGVLIPQ